MSKLSNYLYAKYRAFAPLSCLESPRGDVLRGWQRWQWLAQQRHEGRLIDPTAQIWCQPSVKARLLLEIGASIDRGAIFWISDEADTEGSIHIGKEAYIGPYSFIGSCHKLFIGDHTLIGAHSYVTTVNHRTDRPELPVAHQGFRGGDVVIGHNVWIGCHVTVLPGVVIGDRAVIGAGAVVTKDVPEGETWAGVPARNIKKQGAEEKSIVENVILQS